MSRFSEAEFTAAMERAVEKRGADWCFPTDRSTPGFFFKGIPTYANERGEATCLIGAAMYELGMQLPLHDSGGGSAMAVLREAVPIHVQVAARCAQIHQDIAKPWRESLNVYRAALALARRQGHVEAIYGINTLYYTAVTVVTGRSSADEAMMSLGQAAKAASDAFEAFSFEPEGADKPVVVHHGICSGGWVTPSEVIYSWNDTPVATIMPYITKKEFSIVTGGPFKNDHALTA